MHIVMPLLMGGEPRRYFLLTGQTLSAQEAKDLGLVAEVLQADKVLARAWEHAEALAAKPTLLLRYTRLMFAEYLKKRMQDLLGYALAMEGLALMEQIEPSKSAGMRRHPANAAWLRKRRHRRIANLGKDKLGNGTIICSEQLPAPVFAFANRLRCAPGIHNDRRATGGGSTNPEDRRIGTGTDRGSSRCGCDAAHVFWWRKITHD